MSGGRAEGKGERKSQSGYMLSAQSLEPDVEINIINCGIVSWAKIQSQMHHQMSHPGAHWVSFLCAFVIPIFSLMKYLFKSFAYFLIRCFLFSLLVFESSLHILDTSPLLDMWCTDAFSQYVTSLFIPLIVLLKEQELLNNTKSSLSKNIFVLYF